MKKLFGITSVALSAVTLASCSNALEKLLEDGYDSLTIEMSITEKSDMGEYSVDFITKHQKVEGGELGEIVFNVDIDSEEEQGSFGYSQYSYTTSDSIYLAIKEFDLFSTDTTENYTVHKYSNTDISDFIDDPMMMFDYNDVIGDASNYKKDGKNDAGETIYRVKGDKETEIFRELMPDMPEDVFVDDFYVTIKDDNVEYMEASFITLFSDETLSMTFDFIDHNNTKIDVPDSIDWDNPDYDFSDPVKDKFPGGDIPFTHEYLNLKTIEDLNDSLLDSSWDFAIEDKINTITEENDSKDITSINDTMIHHIDPNILELEASYGDIMLNQDADMTSTITALNANGYDVANIEEISIASFNFGTEEILCYSIFYTDSNGTPFDLNYTFTYL